MTSCDDKKISKEGESLVYVLTKLNIQKLIGSTTVCIIVWLVQSMVMVTDLEELELLLAVGVQVAEAACEPASEALTTTALAVAQYCMALAATAAALGNTMSLVVLSLLVTVTISKGLEAAAAAALEAAAG